MLYIRIWHRLILFIVISAHKSRFDLENATCRYLVIEWHKKYVIDIPQELDPFSIFFLLCKKMKFFRVETNALCFMSYYLKIELLFSARI